MDSNETSCRICLTTNVFFDWTEAVFEFSGPSYKECYYQYTHLQEMDEDLNSPMLCLECGNGLRNAYILVEKAIASDLKLNDLKYQLALQFDNDQVISLDMNNSSNSEKTLTSELNNKKSEFLADNLLQFEKEQVILEDKQNSFDTIIGDCLETNAAKKEHNNVFTEDITMMSTSDDVDFPIIQDSDSTSELEVNKISTINRSSKKKLILLCSYCSRIFNNRNHLHNHEKTHESKRERSEVCTICGLKFYCKYSLNCHMAIHDDNRERKYKCEFCPKAFFARGALNVHRRIHLGQMIKCNFCPKEYSRQIDMDRHVKSHDAMPLTAKTGIVQRVRTKYFRECEICGDKVNSTYWKRHKAQHLNQPTMQCGICSKKFFPCSSVQRHLKQCHGIASAEYKKFLIKLDTKFEPRLSSLMIEQKIMKVYTEK